ncbi:hypothetical protein COLO4_16425 [Corchorus olitorius]|uniref:Uncharacterized protein n=1 Tax=Corchorus olitorius TaxID=93759 RepID=A0A1R3JHP2_9ROSI|nr:hypothetical protein COLO4_16425 [Corchorus olitorius]
MGKGREEQKLPRKILPEINVCVAVGCQLRRHSQDRNSHTTP